MLDKIFPVTGELELRCEFRSGSLSIQARDQLAEARVTITPRDAGMPVEQLFRVELIGDRLEVVEQPENGGSLLQSVLGGDLRSFARDRLFGRTEVDIVVELPAGSAVRAAVSSAAVQATGRIGTTSIGAGSSDIKLELVDGELKLRGGSGTVTVNRVTGAANVKGGSGRSRSVSRAVRSRLPSAAAKWRSAPRTARFAVDPVRAPRRSSWPNRVSTSPAVPDW